MVKIFKYFKVKEWSLIGVSIIFIVFQVWLDLKLPDYMSEITMLVQTEGSAMVDILTAGGYMLICAVLSLVASIIVAAFAARVASDFTARLRQEMFNKVQSFSMEEINGFSTASLITRSTNDITQIQMLIVMGMQALIKSPILAAWALMKILNKSWQWSLTTAVAVLVLIVIISICMSLAIPRFKKLQTLTDELNRVTRENLQGLRVVRAYNAEDYEANKFGIANENLTSTQLFTSRTMATLMPTISAIMSGLTLAIYWVGAIIINQAEAFDRLPLFSDMIVFSSYAVQILMAFMMLVMIFILIPRASVSAKRINEVLDTKASIKDGNITDAPLYVTGKVEFKNVSFRYPDAEDAVLTNISFVANKGETVAFIGSTGSGKSTVINLIPRFYDVTSGEVLVDDINVSSYTQTALRDKIGFVTQKAILFNGSVNSNVSFGKTNKKKPDINDVVDSIYTAQASEFVEKMDNKYESFVAAGGSNLSGGQKQRLSIARAIARRPEILIFDDSFSALDYKTDRKLRSVMKKEIAGTTCLIVAQRIGTIKDADRIIVLDEGTIVGNGTHDELMRNCEVYKEIAYSQLSKEELA